MGSCFAPLVAEFALHMIEQHVTAPRLLTRYVNDVFAIFENEKEAEAFLSSLNSHHPSIQFMMERPIGGQINFLDMTVYLDKRTIKTTGA